MTEPPSALQRLLQVLNWYELWRQLLGRLFQLECTQTAHYIPAKPNAVARSKDQQPGGMGGLSLSPMATTTQHKRGLRPKRRCDSQGLRSLFLQCWT